MTQPPVAPQPTFNAQPSLPPNQQQAYVHNSGYAIAALVLGIFGWLYAVPAILAVIFGHIAITKVKRSQGWVIGKGMAIAGLVLGYVWLALFVVLFIVALTAGNGDTGGTEF